MMAKGSVGDEGRGRRLAGHVLPGDGARDEDEERDERELTEALIRAGLVDPRGGEQHGEAEEEERHQVVVDVLNG